MEYLRCTSSHRSYYAQNFSWNVLHLAPFIGLTFQDASDIQEQYRDLVVQRIALLEKWSQKLGSEATNGKLRDGFQKIGRTDIVEDIDKRCKHPIKSNNIDVNHPLNLHSSFTVIAVITGCFGIIIMLLLHVPMLLVISPMSSNDSSLALPTVPWEETKCDFRKPQSDLPKTTYLFVGREKNISFIINSLLLDNRTHIININGAPGFGKSALAIHMGYKLLLSRCVDVRYIDTNEHYWFRKNPSMKQATTNKHDISHTDLEHWRKPEVKKYYHGEEHISSQSKTQRDLPGLLQWARSVQYPTILILDNCDETLHSELREDFIDLIKQMGQLQHGNIKILITSQERLLLHNTFLGIEIKELQKNKSVSLLKALVPNISSHDAVGITTEVGGSPLALTVIGKMINNSKLEFIPTLVNQLKIKPLTPLDKVSDRKSRFRVIMDTASSYIGRNALECAKCLSNFPGSFDSEAKQEVISSLLIREKLQCDIENLITHSLLEEYFLFNDHRFKMHRLIREYFREKDNGKCNSSFTGIFGQHYQILVLNYMELYVRKEINDQEQRKLLSESHNIKYLSDLLNEAKTNDKTNTLDRFYELTLLFTQPLELYSKDLISQIFFWAIAENTFKFVCFIITKDYCNYYNQEYYSSILENAHKSLCYLDDESGYYYECELLHCYNVTTFTAPICQEVRADVCTQILFLDEACSWGMSTIEHLLNPTGFKLNNIYMYRFSKHFHVLLRANFLFLLFIWIIFFVFMLLYTVIVFFFWSESYITTLLLSLLSTFLFIAFLDCLILPSHFN